MRIAIINQHPLDTIGGSEIQCDIIAQELTKLGHEVTYFAVSAKKPNYPVSYPVEPFPRLDLFALYRAFRHRRIEVVYWRHNKKGLFKTALAAKLAGAKFIYALSSISDRRVWTGSGSSRPLERFMNAWKAGGERWFLRPSLLKLTLDPLYSAANFLALPLFANGLVSQIAGTDRSIPVRKKLTLRNSMVQEAEPFEWKAPYVVWVANIKPKKNPEQFLALAESLKESGVDFLMIGSIQDKAYEAKMTEAPSENFFYLGPKSLREVNGILRDALFLAHTCNPEGFPNNFIQAWLQGKPTLSLYYDPENLISSQGIGFYSQTPENFVSHAARLIQDETLRTSMGSKARQFALENFAPQTNIPKLEAFMRSVL